MDNEQQGKIEILQVLRGIAALGIVYFHTEYGPWKSANWGIDFFFILSGYLIMMSTSKWNPGGQQQKKYWLSRLIKICPLYWGMTIVVIISYRFVPRVFRSTIVTPETIIKSFLFIPCYASNERIFPIYSVAWTTTLEMFFYAIFSLCTQISHKLRGFLAIFVMMVLVLAGMIFTPESAVLRFWTGRSLIDFVFGIMIFYIFQKRKDFRMKSWLAKGLLVIEVALLFAGRYIISDPFYYPWNRVFCAVLLITGLGYKEEVHIKVLVKLGNMSYSLYMVHFLMIGLVCRVLIDNTVLCLKNTLIVVGAIIVTVLISYIVYRIMEVWLINLIVNKDIK